MTRNFMHIRRKIVKKILGYILCKREDCSYNIFLEINLILRILLI